MQEQLFCEFCRQPVENIHIHYQNCLVVRQNGKHFKKSIKMQNETICKICWSLFDKEKFEDHQKNKYKCKQFNIVEPIESLPQIIAGDETHKYIHAPELEQYLKITQSYLKLTLPNWLELNKSLPPAIVLQTYSNNVLSWIDTFSDIKIKVPTFQDLKAFKKIKWEKYFDNSSQLLSNQRVKEAIQRMSRFQKFMATKAINRLAKQFKGITPLKQIQYQSKHKPEQFIKFSTYIDIIFQLFKSKKRNLVHFGIDFYLILLLGQRFLSDRQSLQDDFLAFLEQKSDYLYFQLSVTQKTKATPFCVINKQILAIIQTFNWKGWHPKTYAVMRRLRYWIGFNGHSLRHALANYLTWANTQLAQGALGHNKKETTTIYTSQASLGKRIELANEIFVPLLSIDHYTFEDFKKLEKRDIPNIKYNGTSLGWLQRLSKHFYEQGFSSDYNDLVDFIRPDIEQNLHVEHSHFQDNVMESQSMSASEVSSLNSQPIFAERSISIIKQPKRIIKIYDDQYSMPFGTRFLPKYLYLPPQMKCMYCLAVSEDVDQICGCLIYHKKSNPIIYQEYQRQTLSISFPKEYFRNQMHPALLQIKTLLAARRLRYVSANHCQNNFSQLTFGAKNVLLDLKAKEMKEYFCQKYFPSIQIRQSGHSNHVGTSFGIFATQEINRNVFIGEYASDALLQYQASYARRRDATMILFQGNSSKNTICLMVRDHCGYVPLINGDIENPNCHAMTVIYEHQIKVILVTKRRIMKNQELTYHYGSGYGLQLLQKIKKTRKKRVKEIEQVEQIEEEDQQEEQESEFVI